MDDSDDLFDMFDPSNRNEPIDPELIALFTAARVDATPEELAAETSIVASMLAATQLAPLNVVPIRSSPVRQRFSASRTATKVGIISGVVLFSATAAAAGGVLPDAAQSAVSRAAAHIGVHINNPDDSSADTGNVDSSKATDDASTEVTEGTEAPDTTTEGTEARETTTEHTASDGTAHGPDATGPAKAGLCQAWVAHQRHPNGSADSQAMKNLQDAAKSAKQTVEAFCAPTTPHSTPGKPVSPGKSGSSSNSSSSGSGASDESSRASTLPPAPSTTPSVTLPPQAHSGVTLPVNANTGSGNSSHADGRGNSHGG